MRFETASPPRIKSKWVRQKVGREALEGSCSTREFLIEEFRKHYNIPKTVQPKVAEDSEIIEFYFKWYVTEFQEES